MYYISGLFIILILITNGIFARIYYDENIGFILFLFLYYF